MDWKKIINVALIPTAVLIVVMMIGLVSILLGKTSMLDPVLFAIECLVLLYAGYITTKKHKLSLESAALVGAVALLVSTIIYQIIYVIVLIIGPPSTASTMVIPKNFTWLILIGLIPTAVVIWFVEGVVFGAIGGFIGQKTK